MPTPRKPNIIDRFLDHGAGNAPRGRERTLLEAGELPLWVQLFNVLILLGLMAGAVMWAFVKYDWLTLPCEPPWWPHPLVFFPFIYGMGFLIREIRRQYGKRAERERQASQ